MNSEPLYRRQPYCQEINSLVLAVDGQMVMLAESPFYPQGGGQPGDSGWLNELRVENTVKGEQPGTVWHVLAEGQAPPEPGSIVTARLEWPRRHLHMRVHTALHLLSVVIPLPVTGGQISAGKGRLDFDMPEPPQDVSALEAALNALISADHPVTEEWITDAELIANPGLVKTMSVKPPMGQGRVRMVRIGDPAASIDWQPCGGTHVARTAEIGPVRLGKIEKKGKINRRVNLMLAEFAE